MSLTGVVGDVILFGSLCIMFRRYHSRLAGFAFVLDGFCPSKWNNRTDALVPCWGPWIWGRRPGLRDHIATIPLVPTNKPSLWKKERVFSMSVIVPRNFKLLQEYEDGEKGKGIADSSHANFITYGIESPENPDLFLHSWHAMLIGPQGERMWSLEIFVTDRYPQEAPQIQFLTKINLRCVDQKTGLVQPRAVPEMSASWDPIRGSIASCLVGIRKQILKMDFSSQPSQDQSWSKVHFKK